MLFISAQPDDTYFIWQLEIQIRNLRGLGITKENIHVLVGINSKTGFNPLFKEFVIENDLLASFYLYEDDRVKKDYLSSIRPNILSQHFKKFPELVDRILFYHDSDVLFSRIPYIEDLESNDICYVSDTRHYTDAAYIRKVGTEILLDKMLAAVGLNKAKFEQENLNAGGAQYILKGMTSDFWKKIELDSEKLYSLMEDHNLDAWGKAYASEKKFRSEHQGIQAWCADMWAVLWNLWLMDRKVEIHHEMGFSWPDSPIQNWKKFAMLHYSGNMKSKDRVFKKSTYLNFMPWHDVNLRNIDKTTCSYKIVEAINKRRKELATKRIKFDFKVILLEVSLLNKSKYESFITNKCYIDKYFDIDIFLLVDKIHDDIEDQQYILNRTSLLKNKLFYEKQLSYVIMPIYLVLNINQWLNILSFSGRNCSFTAMSSYQLDNLFHSAFSKILDVVLLDENIGKFNRVHNPIHVFIFDWFNLLRYLKKESFIIETRFESLTPYLLIA